MQLSFNWLKEYVRTTKTAEQVADIFTLAGFEVETTTPVRYQFARIVVGEIRRVAKHPQADKLQLAYVTTDGRNELEIVCGATNIAAGQKVPVAQLGATLPNGVTIEKRAIRGITSHGMLCAPDELGLGMDHSGIFILDPKVPVGTPLGKLFPDDTVFDVAVSPQRSDCLSVIGLAREFASLTGGTFQEPRIRVTESATAVTKNITVGIVDGKRCPRYTGRVVRGVTVGPSPAWLQAKLLVMGKTPVNTIVDITNYVLLEYGQPLHAFDLNRVAGKKINVRTAGTVKSFTTLDGETRKLPTDALLIWDARQPIAIAGIMGGLESRITPDTTDVVIESAIFEPLSIRKTRQRLGLMTDASVRFERGIWWELPEQALDRAAQLMAEVAGGTVAKGRVGETAQAPKRAPINVAISEINSLLGIFLKAAAIKRHLQTLGFSIKPKGKESFLVIPPAWRTDIALAADVIEEVGRLHGLNNITPQPVYAALRPVQLPPLKKLERRVADLLVAAGFTEVKNYSFYGERELRSIAMPRLLPVAEHSRIENPLNPSQAYLRTSLLPWLAENVGHQVQQFNRIALFEIGTVFVAKMNSKQPDERLEVAGMVFERGGAMERGADVAQQVRGTIEALLKRIGVSSDRVDFRPSKTLGQGIKVLIDKEEVGRYDRVVTPRTAHGQAYYFEIDLHRMPAALGSASLRYRPLEKYPAMERDFTFQTPTSSPLESYSDIRNAIIKVSPLVVEVRGTSFKVMDGHARASFAITFQAPDHTLTAGEVNMIEAQIEQLMKSQFNYSRIK